MMDIDKIIEQIIVREGGYVDHDADRGSHTRWGITIDTLSEWLGREATVEEVKNLPKETAKEIYKKRYYFEPKINKLPESIQSFVLDTAIHSGPKRAISLVQKSCNRNGFPAGLVDGVIGPKTTKAAYKFDRMFLDELIDLRESFLLSIIENDPSQAAFGSGWMNRLEEFRE